MSFVDTFDASGFDAALVGTWPAAPAGGYEPGHWWYVTTAGTVGSVTANVGDRLYPFGVGRRFGELGFGDELFGGPVPAPPWAPDPARVEWRVVRYIDAPAWERPPAPYDGCEFRDGWRIVLEVFQLGRVGRTYGEGTYGEGVYGDVDGSGPGWRDVTPATFGAAIRVGADDGSPAVDVDSATFELLDTEALLFPMAPSADRRAVVTSPIRCSFIDPDGNPLPLFTGRIASIADDHDGEGVRTVTVSAFGMASDLARTVSFDRAAESPETRLRALIALAGYTWGVAGFPPSTDTLRRTDPQTEVGARGWIDATALSARWSMRTDALGLVTFSPWPLAGAGDVIEVTDQIGAVELAASEVALRADDVELLNRVTVASSPVQGSAELTSSVDDPPSIAAFGLESEALGFPATGLSAEQAALDALAADALARFSRVATRLAAFTVHDTTEPRWLEVAAELAAGRPVTFRRTKPDPTTFAGVVVGFEHRIVPGRISSTVYVSTLTKTEL